MTPEQLVRLPEVLFQIGKAIGSDEDLGLLLSRISQLVCELVGADACSVMLLDVRGELLLTKAAHGLPTERLHRISFRVGEGVAGWVLEQGQAALIDDVTRDERFVAREDSRTPIGSMACVPLLARGERVGVMTATSAKTGAFSADNLDMLGFLAKTIALDIENIRLHRLSVTDTLTGAFNREFLQRHLPFEIERAVEGKHALSVAMVDIDHFKEVNDKLGHDKGDLVLAEVVNRLRLAVRKNDVIIRYGGEEFLVVLPHAEAGRAWEVGERMRLKFQNRVVDAGSAIEIRISVGVAQHKPATVHGSAETPSDLIRRADTALYIAKGRGRNRVEVAP